MGRLFPFLIAGKHEPSSDPNGHDQIDLLDSCPNVVVLNSAATEGHFVSFETKISRMKSRCEGTWSQSATERFHFHFTYPFIALIYDRLGFSLKALYNFSPG
jgi:hypothetical protein